VKVLSRDDLMEAKAEVCLGEWRLGLLVLHWCIVGLYLCRQTGVMLVGVVGVLPLCGLLCISLVTAA
jgi:hypothetical protein